MNGIGRWLRLIRKPKPDERTPALASVEAGGRQGAEEQLRTANRALRLISLFNQELVRASDESALLQTACRLVVEAGGYLLAWIGLAENDAACSVHPAAQAGFEDGYLRAIRVTWADNERGQGPIGLAIRTGRPVAFRDLATHPAFAPWREEAARRGYQSVIALPLIERGRSFGALTVYATASDAFDSVETKLLTELAEDLSYGMNALRLQAAKEKTETENRRLAAFPELNPNPVLEFAADGALTYHNPAARELSRNFGLRGVAGLLPANAALIVRQCLATGQPHLRLETAYGARTLSWSFYPISEINAVHCYVGDITDRKETETKIREQARLLDETSDAILVRNPAGAITFWNRGAEKLFGWTASEIAGQEVWTTLVAPEARDKREAAERELMANGHWLDELAYVTKAGKPLIGQVRATLLHDALGTAEGALMLITDITEKKALEDRFLRAQRMEHIGALAGGIAHDLNNLLAPILMALPLLRAGRADPESARILDTMERCTRRGAEILRQMLTYARGAPAARLPVPLRQLLGEITKLAAETFPRNIQIEAQAPPELWPVLGDATQIHQALMNLCVNARDAMPDGGRLTLAAVNRRLDEATARLFPDIKAGDYVCVSVTDTGVGIPAAQLDHIFEPFFTTKEIGKGTGLGLATVHGIVRGHGGFVQAKSQLGRGTVFELCLPASSEAPVAALRQQPGAPTDGRDELILVVDDEAGVRDLIERTLTQHGYRVETAAEGAAALSQFQCHRGEIRAVLTDLMMPGTDGPGLVWALRQAEPRLPILGMTGLGERVSVHKLESLAVPVLHKPFAAGDLLAELRRCLHANSSES